MITLAALTARCERTTGSFTFTEVANTPLGGGGNMPFQPAMEGQRLVPHANASRTAIGWSAVYRTHRLSGNVLVVDSSVASVYVQSVLDAAWLALDAWDLRQQGTSGPVGQPNPSTGQQGY